MFEIKENMQNVKHYCTTIKINDKLKLLGGLYINSVFWGTVFGGCYGFGKAIKDKKRALLIVNDVVESALFCGIICTCLPYSIPKYTYNYIKHKME